MVNRGALDAPDPFDEPGLERAQRRAGTGRTSQLPPGMNLRTPLTPDELEAISGSFFEDPHPEYRSPIEPIRPTGIGYTGDEFEEFLSSQPNERGALARNLIFPEDARSRAVSKLQDSNPGAMMTLLQAGFDVTKEAAGPIPPAIGSGIVKTFTTPWGGDESDFFQTNVPPEGLNVLDRLDRIISPIDEAAFTLGIGQAAEHVLPFLTTKDMKERNNQARDVMKQIFFDDEGNFQIPNTASPQVSEMFNELYQLNLDRPWYERILTGLGLAGVGATRKLGAQSIRLLARWVDRGAARASKAGLKRTSTFAETARPSGFEGVGPLISELATERGGLSWRFTGSGQYATVQRASDEARTAINLPDLYPGLSRWDELKNIPRNLAFLTPRNAIIQPAHDMVEEVTTDMRSTAAAISHTVENMAATVFSRDKEGRIYNDKIVAVFGKKPTLADLAARLDDYWEILSPNQQREMMKLKETLKPFDDLVAEMGDPRKVYEGERAFYIPRGSVDDGIESINNGKRGGGRKSTNAQTFDWSTDTIEWAATKGYIVPKVGDALDSYIMDVTTRATNRHAQRYLLEALDPETGVRLATTQGDRIDKALQFSITKARETVRRTLLTGKLQAARSSVLGKTVTRAQREADKGETRLLRAEDRLAVADEGYSASDLKLAKDDLRETTKEVITFTSRGAVLGAEYRVANKAANTSEKAFFNALDDLNTDVTSADQFLNTAVGSVGNATDIKAMESMSIRMTRKLENLTETFEEAAGNVDEIIDARNIAKNVLASERANITEANKVIRNMTTRERVLMGYEREVRMLAREQARLERMLVRAETSADQNKIRTMITELKLKDAQDTYSKMIEPWAKNVRSSRKPDLGEAGIDLFGLDMSVGFPESVAMAAKDIIEKSALEQFQGGLQAYNNLYRGLRSTGDFSAFGIQGLMGMNAQPLAAMKATKVMFESVGSAHALGAFMGQFDNIATETGRLGATGWAKRGIRIGAGNTEFKLGQGFSAGLEDVGFTVKGVDVRPIAQSNRAFGYYSDVLRLQWADDLLREELEGGGFLAKKLGRAKPRTLEEITESGDLEKIATFVNNATGWSKNKTFGTAGDLLLFAPRFLNARLTTVVNGIKGLKPGASIENRLARRALTRLIAQGSTMTFALNWMLGEETDTHPWLDDNFEPTYNWTTRKNPNFMRVRFGGRDWSLFGPYDSLLGVFINPISASRGLASGPVQILVDQFKGETFGGKRDVPQLLEGEIMDDPAAFFQWILMGHMPFAWEESAIGVQDIAKGITERDVVGVGSGVATIGSEVLGTKSSKMTEYEKQQIVHKTVMEEMGFDADSIWDLPFDEQALVREDLRVVEADNTTAEARVGRNPLLDKYKTRMETGRTDFKKKVDGYQILSERSYRGELGPDEHPIFGRELRSKIATAQRDYARDRETLRKYAEEDGILEEWYDDDPSQHPADKAYAAYVKMVFDDDLEDDESGYFDFKERDKRLKELRDGPLTITDEDGKVIEVLQDGYGNEIIDKVEDELRKGEPHIVKKLREDRKRLDGYFKEFDRIIQTAGLEDVWERYKRTPPEDRSTFLRRTDSRDLKDVLNYINNGNSVIKSPKIRWIEEKGEWADRLLIQWGYRSKAVFENVAKEFQARQIAIAERELTP